MNCSTSPAFVNISPPWAVRPCPFRTGVLPQDPPGTLGARGFRAVSQVFHACYGMAVERRRRDEQRRWPHTRRVLAGPAPVPVPWGRGRTAARWVLAGRHAGPPGNRRRGHLPRAAVRAAGGGQRLGREHRPAAAGPAARLAAVHAYRVRRLPLAVVDTADLRGRDLPAHG